MGKEPDLKNVLNDIGNKLREEGKIFKKVWYRSKENKWTNLSPITMQDSGKLLLIKNKIEYEGNFNHITINYKNITSINLRQTGKDFVNYWVVIEYFDDDKKLKKAFFADGRKMGWSGVNGGTEQMKIFINWWYASNIKHETGIDLLKA